VVVITLHGWAVQKNVAAPHLSTRYTRGEIYHRCVIWGVMRIEGWRYDSDDVQDDREQGSAYIEVVTTWIFRLDKH
jgi:hypothetical protein